MIISPCKKSYSGRVVLDMPEFQLVPGNIYAVLGANGSGKSTLARLLAGVTKPDGGGRVLPGDVAVGYMPQKSLAFQMSVIKNVMLGAENTTENRGRAQALLHELNLEHLEKQAANGLSGGETARMALARVLMCASDLLILDEPTASMDVCSALAAEKLMLQYWESTGCAVMLVTHSLSQALRVADEALFLNEGKLIEHGPAAQVLSEPNEKLTRQFIDFYS